jgi:oxidoreductase
MTQSILFCGRGWAATQLWIPRLQRFGLQSFSFYDPAKAAVDSREEALLPSLDLANPATTMLAIVASPNCRHQDQALKLLRLGIPVIIEKPVCMSTEACRALMAAAEGGGVSALRSCVSLYDPHFRKFVALFAELAPELGSIRRVEAHWLRADGIPASPWLTTAAYAMAGSSLDLGWHLLEWIMALLDHPPMVVQSAAFSGGALNAVPSYAPWYGDKTPSPAGSLDVDTAATLSLATETGIEVELLTAWDADIANDEVAVAVTGQDGSLSLRTILGMSPNGPELPRIEGRACGREILKSLPHKIPGAAHDEMVEQFVAAAFDPASLGQSWGQLQVMAAVAEQIVARHSEWRASFP